ncbi:hypothetical protein DFJ74DRAFT_757272 [Hyaloraphidium curvatum]|nr:hypothetical protein DFJ74DRAFT_757272 [Hyaloraphidium curvatum]
MAAPRSPPPDPRGPPAARPPFQPDPAQIHGGYPFPPRPLFLAPPPPGVLPPGPVSPPGPFFVPAPLMYPGVGPYFPPAPPPFGYPPVQGGHRHVHRGGSSSPLRGEEENGGANGNGSDTSGTTAADRRASSVSQAKGDDPAYAMSDLAEALPPSTPTGSASDDPEPSYPPAYGGQGRSLVFTSPPAGPRGKKVQPPPGSQCRYFIQGRCWAGEQCRWSHAVPPYYYPVQVGAGPPQFVQWWYPPGEGANGGEGSPTGMGMQGGGGGGGFLGVFCGKPADVRAIQGRNGGEARNGNGGGSEARGEGRNGGGPGAQCFYWRQGRCRFGAQCRFAHS